MSKKIFKDNIDLGILKGGQLGRMLLDPCAHFGLIPHVLDSDPKAPAHAFTHHFTVADADNFEDVYQWGKSLDMITLEIEHINLDALKQLKEEGIKICPDPEVLAIVQDKGRQKVFYQHHEFPTADFFFIETKQELYDKIDLLPLVQKSRRAGYDGRGVKVLRTEKDLNMALDVPSVLEQKVDIKMELAVIVARNAQGSLSTYPPVEMVFHEDANMLDYLIAPARIDQKISQRVDQLARDIASTINLVGIMAVEFFVTTSNEVLVNEIAPRPHNSGHHTIEGNVTSQYEQHIRAIMNLPLGSTQQHKRALMWNIIGEPGHEGPVVYEGLEKFLSYPDVYIHIYGKEITRPFRKLGHITILRDDFNEALEIVDKIKQEVKAISCQTSK